MNQFRASLTRLKNLITEKLPDTPDIYGYPGVRKTSLLAALDGVYVLSQEIQDDDRFEIVALKRAGSELYRRLKEYLEAEATQDEKRVSFNGFLDGLSQLIEKTRMTYFVVVKHGLRDDEELAKIRSTAAELLQTSDDLKDSVSTVTGQVEEIAASVTAINDAHERTEKQSGAIKAWHDSASTSATKIEQIRKNLEGLDEEIGEQKQTLKDMGDRLEKLLADSTISKDRLAQLLAQTEATEATLGASGRRHAELLEKINLSLEDANRIGMAASFKARKDELRSQQTSWQVTFIGTLFCIVLAVWHFILPTVTGLQKDMNDWTRLIAELGIVSPLIWLGWFAAKQYGYISRIREDYAFKSAAAMAYEGHKKAARETDKTLEEVLLQFSLYNMSQNPIRLYGDKDVHGTPAHEVASGILDKLKRFKKVSAESPTFGRVEIVAEDKDS